VRGKDNVRANIDIIDLEREESTTVVLLPVENNPPGTSPQSPERRRDLAGGELSYTASRVSPLTLILQSFESMSRCEPWIHSVAVLAECAVFEPKPRQSTKGISDIDLNATLILSTLSDESCFAFIA